MKNEKIFKHETIEVLENMKKLLIPDYSTGFLYTEAINRTTGETRLILVNTYKVGRGYLQMCFWKNYYVHRVLWALYTGSWPEKIIDHIDGNKTNNRISNLQEVSESYNKQKESNSCAGIYKRGSRYRAQISAGIGSINLGTFDTVEEAVSARQAAICARHGET